MDKDPSTKTTTNEGNRDSETHTDVVKEREETYQYQHGLLINKSLELPSYEYPIQPSDRGLFVIIKNIEFHYQHCLTKGLRTFKNLKEQYNQDFKNLKETFKFEENDPNVRYAEDLVAEDSPDKKSPKFDEFMQERVLGYEGDPKFVMVVLMSHGLSNGIFVLGEKEDKKVTEPLHQACCRMHRCDKGKTKKAEEGKISCCQEAPHECCAVSPGELHTQKGACRERKIKENLIEPLQKKFPDIPKIFLLQVCRGGRADDLLQVKGKKEKKKEEEQKTTHQSKEDDTSSFDFLLGSSNSLVLYGGAEGQITWVVGKGSFLIFEFCEAVNGVKERLKKVSTKLDQLKKSENDGTGDEVQKAMDSLLSEMKGQHPDANIRVSAESIVGGWFEDICRMTAANVARRYMIEEKGIDQHSNGNKELVSRKALTKSQPEVRSSLHSKLSCIKMMSTQDKSWGNQT